MRTGIRLLLVVLITFGVATALHAQGGRGAEEVLKFVKEAHRASRELIRTCSCRVEFKSTMTAPGSSSPKEDSLSALFWYSPTSVRGQVTERGRTVNYVWADSVQQSVTRSRVEGQRMASASRGRTNKYLPRADAYIRGLLVLNVPGTTECVPFEQLSERANRLLDARRITRDGKEMIRVRLQFEEPRKEKSAWKVEIDFDPSVNYLVRKTVYTSAKNYVREDEVMQFKESAPGVFFPEKLTGRAGPSGKFDFEHSTTLSEIQVNRPLPEGIFRLRYPPGLYMHDTVRGTRYKIDSDGNRISPEEPRRKGKGTPPPPLAEEPSRPRTATEEEPRPWTRWILPVSSAILLVGLAAALVRRYRKSGTGA